MSATNQFEDEVALDALASWLLSEYRGLKEREGPKVDQNKAVALFRARSAAIPREGVIWNVVSWKQLRALERVKVRKDWGHQAKKSCGSMAHAVLIGPLDPAEGPVMVLDGSKRFRHALKCAKCMNKDVRVYTVYWTPDSQQRCVYYDPKLFE